MNEELDKVIDSCVNELLEKRFEQTKNWDRPNNKSDEELKVLQRKLYYEPFKIIINSLYISMTEFLTEQIINNLKNDFDIMEKKDVISNQRNP